jgi:hypothetical protein
MASTSIHALMKRTDLDHFLRKPRARAAIDTHIDDFAWFMMN